MKRKLVLVVVALVALVLGVGIGAAGKTKTVTRHRTTTVTKTLAVTKNHVPASCTRAIDQAHKLMGLTAVELNLLNATVHEVGDAAVAASLGDATTVDLVNGRVRVATAKYRQVEPRAVVVARAFEHEARSCH
jgi:hypothetical protein